MNIEIAEREYLEMKLAQYETLVEATAPPPVDCRCRCTRCLFGARYIRREDQDDAA